MLILSVNRGSSCMHTEMVTVLLSQDQWMTFDVS